MRHAPIDPRLFISNRERLKKLLLKNSLAVINANDVLPTNADGTLALRQNSDLFYLTGIEQEETILLLFPDADEEKHREVLILRRDVTVFEDDVQLARTKLAPHPVHLEVGRSISLSPIMSP